MVYVLFFFFFNDTATTEIYTLSLHDALPIFGYVVPRPEAVAQRPLSARDLREFLRSKLPSYMVPTIFVGLPALPRTDRKSTRLNSSHANISYAVFCLKKKKNQRCT